MYNLVKVYIHFGTWSLRSLVSSVLGRSAHPFWSWVISRWQLLRSFPRSRDGNWMFHPFPSDPLSRHFAPGCILHPSTIVL